MAKNDIGGFFVSLGLNPDKNSFETGNKLIDGVTTGLNKLIGTARNAAVVLTGTAVASGVMATQTSHTADLIGTSAEKLNVWRAAAKIAGADANGLVGSISKLSNVMNHMTIDGSGLEAYAKQLGYLGLSIQDLMAMDPADAMEKILATAQGKLDGTNETKMRTTTIVQDLLGDAGAQLFVELARSNQSIADFLSGAEATQYQTNEGINNAADFNAEVKKLVETGKSISLSIGDNIAGALVGPARTLNQWLTDHKTDISNGIEKIGAATEKLVSKIGDWWEKNGDKVLNYLQLIGTGVTTIIGWLTSEKSKGFFKGIKEQFAAGWNTSKELVKSLWTGDGQTLQILQDGMDQMWDAMKSTIGIEDGIIRPDGRVTPIAPDDWVFAARDVSDMAKAFIPQGMAAVNAPAEYSIVQNFTITGSNDIPQVLKQQAYRGTQEGLMAIMQQSSQRLQMMSGTR
jgi:hypothetical protein